MKRWTELTVVLCALCGALHAAENQPGAASYDDYKAVYEKNIFSRSRVPASAASDTNGAVRTERVVLSLYVLRGVAIETSSRLAFVEDEISGQFKRLAAGDSLLNGVVTDILADRVVFKAGEQARDVRIGQEFDRVESVVERAADAPASSTDPNRPAAAPAVQKTSAPASSSSESDILKQLMERRRKELGS